jgi:biopolymer transport protein ExbD
MPKTVILTKIYTTISFNIILQMRDRRYEKKMQTVEKFIRKHGTTDHVAILNELDIDYDTLMKILSELRNKGFLK